MYGFARVAILEMHEQSDALAKRARKETLDQSDAASPAELRLVALSLTLGVRDSRTLPGRQLVRGVVRW